MHAEEDRIEESERSTREGNIAKKVKKKNKIQIKERLRSLFYTTFRREERRRKSKPRREKEQQ